MSAGGVLLDCDHDFKVYSVSHSTLGRVFHEGCSCGARRDTLPDYHEWMRKHFPGALEEGLTP